MNNLTIHLETEKDYRAVEELTREVFGTSINPVPPPIVARTPPQSKHATQLSLQRKRSGCRAKRSSISIAILR